MKIGIRILWFDAPGSLAKKLTCNAETHHTNQAGKSLVAPMLQPLLINFLLLDHLPVLRRLPLPEASADLLPSGSSTVGGGEDEVGAAAPTGVGRARGKGIRLSHLCGLSELLRSHKYHEGCAGRGLIRSGG